MEFASLGRVVLSFFFVVGLMLLIAWLMRRLGLDKKLQGRVKGSGSLALEESLYLDPRRRLVIVSHHERRYLLLLSQNSDMVLDTLPPVTEKIDAPVV